MAAGANPELNVRLARGEYDIDPRAVAEAILRQHSLPMLELSAVLVAAQFLTDAPFAIQEPGSRLA